MGSKNHEVVPTPLIQSLAGPKIGTGVHRNISALAKVGLIAKVKNAKYDGYRLTYGGLDYLSLNTHRKADHVYSLGNQIGVGKESDIYVVAGPDGRKLVLKLHRLGRISFRTVKANRDYLRNRNSGSWMYLSRLAAQKEYAFMTVLRREGFLVPEPVAQSRHTIVMEFIDAFPLRQIQELADPAALYSELMHLIIRLARVGLIHGDFNEFNVLIKEEKVSPQDASKSTHDSSSSHPAQDQDQALEDKSEFLHHSTKEEQASGQVKLTPVLIDFPQMLSTTHQNAKYYFDRDVDCVKRYFSRRYKYDADEDGPFFADAIKDSEMEKRLDVEVEATGFSRKMAKDLEKYIEAVGMQNEAEQDALNVDGAGENYDEDEEDDQEQAEQLEPEDLQNEQIHDPELVEEIQNLDLGDKNIPTPITNKDDGLAPIDLPKEPDVVLEEKKSKKKAAGWSI